MTNKEIIEKIEKNRLENHKSILSSEEYLLVKEILTLQKEEFEKMIEECSNIKCGWSEDICDRIDKQELLNKVKRDLKR